MSIKLHPHAQARLIERGVTEEEVISTVEGGVNFPAQLGRTGFRCNFVFNAEWGGKFYSTKKVEVIAVQEAEDWLVITVIAKYF
ncbi:hypothetical protein DSM106972_062860 [Dulcicalothrix desertica PCC 7102]|uniref:DUF4258 domain-containing protein n=1 Tax=Dulcicalothrix desertica PCC 7102 TaxID=232991 RepID=A0A3S1AJE2_9CYAN|nr:DUF4258 domain-containing protein [Dulcicalothrix desertica]RUT02211.1 hypothetical protein DSM106972_062860 [Dulcicalothrix desertica PCC 7102]TWH53849.1 uncharacterized protein DUF4258 [Dulcicalothrix desertica PCC 7102]